MKRLILLLTACLYFLSGLLSGQTNQTVSIRTLALDINAAKSERYVKTSEGYELLVFLGRHPGTIIEAYIGENGLPLFKKIEAVGQKEIYQVVREINLPEGARSILLLGWGRIGEERYLPVNDKFLDASYNSWLMINTTEKALGFKIGKDEEPFFIEPNSIEICKVAVPEGRGAAVLGRAKLNGEIKTFYSTYWPIRSGERSIVIFFEEGDRLRLRKVSDALLKKKPDAERL